MADELTDTLEAERAQAWFEQGFARVDSVTVLSRGYGILHII